MRFTTTFGLAAGLLTLAGCADDSREPGPRHDVSVRMLVKIPFSADYNWSFQSAEEQGVTQRMLAGDSGRGGYYYFSDEYHITNVRTGTVYTATGSLAPCTSRSTLPSSAYISMRIKVDGDVKADTTINSLMPTTRSGERVATLRVKL